MIYIILPNTGILRYRKNIGYDIYRFTKRY